MISVSTLLKCGLLIILIGGVILFTKSLSDAESNPQKAQQERTIHRIPLTEPETEDIRTIHRTAREIPEAEIDDIR